MFDFTRRSFIFRISVGFDQCEIQLVSRIKFRVEVLKLCEKRFTSNFSQGRKCFLKVQFVFCFSLKKDDKGEDAPWRLKFGLSTYFPC